MSPEYRQFAAWTGSVPGWNTTAIPTASSWTSIEVPKALEPLGVRHAMLEKVLTHVEDKGWKPILRIPGHQAVLAATTVRQRLLLKGVQLR